MPNKVLKLDAQDNVLIALSDLRKGQQFVFDSQTYALESEVPAKHKFTPEDLAPAASVRMYGALVGKADQPIHCGA